MYSVGKLEMLSESERENINAFGCNVVPLLRVLPFLHNMPPIERIVCLQHISLFSISSARRCRVHSIIFFLSSTSQQTSSSSSFPATSQHRIISSSSIHPLHNTSAGILFHPAKGRQTCLSAATSSSHRHRSRCIRRYNTRYT